MRNAEAILNIIRKRGQRGLPLEEVYRLLFRRDLYLSAYGKLYANAGAMTKGATDETVDGMKLAKIDTIIQDLRSERYRWTPVRRTYIPKKNGKQRPLGMPSWSDKLLQEVIRMILEAYYEPQFSRHSHGFRPRRGCHTALSEIRHLGTGTKWFIEGDISGCFDNIDHSVLQDILREKIHDNRFLRLLGNLLKAGYLENWKFNQTLSGVPQGGVASPILSNLVLDRLDKFVETTLIPTNTRGSRRRRGRQYNRLKKAARRAWKRGDIEQARALTKEAEHSPSVDPSDPGFRRLWYVRYADDFLLGFIGPKSEADAVKQTIGEFLKNKLKLDMSDEKTLLTHARNGTAKFLGYEVHVLHGDDQRDHRGQRCINGGIGLKVPRRVIDEHCSKYMRRGKPVHRTERINDSVYDILVKYQAEYGGIVQYYRLAYNLRTFGRLRQVVEQSLVKTLAQKLRISCSQVYRRYKTTIDTPEGTFKVLQVKVNRGPKKKPLEAHFGGVSLKWNPHVLIRDVATEVWCNRSQVIDRMLHDRCELCGAKTEVEMHHIRKLADIDRKGQTQRPVWVVRMIAWRRKSLALCRDCHTRIHAGSYDGPAITK